MTGWWSSSPEPVALPAGRVACGTVDLPSSKSLTHRAYALALLAGAPLRVERPLDAQDTRLFLQVLETMGHRLEREENAITVSKTKTERLSVKERQGQRQGQRPRLECGNAGTLFRFLVALCCVVPGEWEIDGTLRLRERPVGPLVDALLALGVRIEFLGARGCAPLVVAGGRLPGGRVGLDAGASSQYLSALLLAGQRAAGPIEIEVPALASAPYVDLTLDLVRRFGGRVDQPRPGTWITHPSELQGGVVSIEPDLSAAGYPAAAAAITGGDVFLNRVFESSLQGDRRFLELVRTMGAEVTQEPEGVRVRGTGSLVAIEADLSDIPDQVPTLAAVAPFARGTTRIVNVAHLRIKESDRLAAMASELARAGVPVRELADGLVIEGVWAAGSGAAPPSSPVVVDPHDDHRIAMAMALVGLRRPGISIGDPAVVGKSWPGFWTELARWLSEPAVERS